MSFRALSPCCNKKLLLVSRACDLTRCLLPTHCWDWVYMVIFPSSQRGNHLIVVLATVRAAWTLPGLWPHFGWAPDKCVLEEVGPQKTATVGLVVPARSFAPREDPQWSLPCSIHSEISKQICSYTSGNIFQTVSMLYLQGAIRCAVSWS